MRILVIDSFFPRRDPAQTDMYVAMTSEHTIITDNNVMTHALKGDYDVLYLGTYHHRMEIDWNQLLFLNGDKPVLIDQSDNEEFVTTGFKYPSKGDVTVLSRYLPNEELSKFCEDNSLKLALLPWYINPQRIPYRELKDKTCDVNYSCSLYGKRLIIKDIIYDVCKNNGYTSVIGEYWGLEYATLLAKSRVFVIECERKCLTMKYIEGSLCNCTIIGDVPLYPKNNLSVIECSLAKPAHVEKKIKEALSAPPNDNRQYMLDTYANKAWFMKYFNSLL